MVKATIVTIHIISTNLVVLIVLVVVVAFFVIVVVLVATAEHEVGRVLKRTDRAHVAFGPSPSVDGV